MEKLHMGVDRALMRLNTTNLARYESYREKLPIRDYNSELPIL